MNLTLSLNGKDWVCKPYIGEDWLLRSAHSPATRDQRGWIAAEVPGSVQNDLWAAKQIPSPYEGRNSLAIEWTAARTWVYKRAFTPSAAWSAGGGRVRLVFWGVDYHARFFLNGEALGEHHDMYTPAVFDLTGRLMWDEENLLAVVIDPVPLEQPQIGYTSRVRTNKARMNYSWDFCPRLPHQGIWSGVELLVSGPAAVEDAWVRAEPDESGAKAWVTTQVEVDAAAGGLYELRAALLYRGETVAQEITQHVASEGGRFEFSVTSELAAPRLWWPNGFGEQNLYEAEITVLTGREGALEVSDRRVVPFGIRRLELIQNEGAAEGALGYTVRVNGQRIYTRGWNWVPMDALYGPERPERLRHLLELAKRAGVTLLRVWGGGLIEKEAFYNQCDRLGILVWQEFIQSSSGIDNTAPDEPGMVAWFSSEARTIVRLRRSHPCLALWCGGNELMYPDGRPLDEGHPMLAALRQVVAELDPGRAWLPTSSSGPYFANDIPSEEKPAAGFHDVHGPWEYKGVEKQYALYNAASSLFHSEFGAEGLTNPRALAAVLPEADRLPVSLDNPAWMHLAAWWVKEKEWRAVFGPMNTIEEHVQATQFMQFEGVRYAVEANRRRAFRNSGSIPWQFNEPYPNPSCTSAVDYFGEPKPMYWGVKNAYAPAAVTARYETIAWGGRDQFEAEIWAAAPEGRPLANARLAWRLTGQDGAEFASGDRMFSTAADRPQKVSNVRFPIAKMSAALFLLDLCLEGEDGAELAHNRYLFSTGETLSAIFRAAPAEIETRVQVEDNGWRVTLHNPGVTAALYIYLSLDADPREGGWALFDSNYFCLLPGETRSTTVTFDRVPRERRAIMLTGWNIPTQVIRKE